MVPLFVWELLMIFVLILANGFFAAAEIAVIAARRGRLEQQAQQGDRGAQTALDLARNPNRFLPTVQVGITLVGTFAAAFGGAQIAENLSERFAEVQRPFVVAHRDGLALGIVVVGISACQLVIGELVPKRLALRHAESLARIVALPMQLLSQISRPIIWSMGLATDAVLWIFGAAGPDEDTSVSLEDVQHLIKVGTSEGLFELAEQKVALEALRLSDRTVREVMRPRIELEAVDVHTPASEVIGTLAMAGFSRLPVYDGDLDHILGFIHIKDLFRQQYLGWPIELRRMLHPALFVPETLPLDRLLQLFQEKRTQLAVVLDEFGGTEGVVTMEDVLEELVGEIRDEHDRDRTQEIIRRDDSSWLVDGRVTIDELVESLQLKLQAPAAPRNYNTVAGLVLERLGRIPRVGDCTTWDGMTLEVVDMDGKRIDRVLICTAPADQTESQA